SDCTVWQTVLQGAVEPMHAIMVRHMFMEGDKILLLRGLPSAKALIEAARGLEADFTSAR
ncbi:MAG: putative sterol carrier protein, partial [Glaciecola sp.]